VTCGSRGRSSHSREVLLHPSSGIGLSQALAPPTGTQSSLVGGYFAVDEGAADRFHEGHRSAEVDVGVAGELDCVKVDQAERRGLGGGRFPQVLLPVVQGRRRWLVYTLLQLTAMGLAGGGAVGVQR
jgi:hypothetical protein